MSGGAAHLPHGACRWTAPPPWCAACWWTGSDSQRQQQRRGVEVQQQRRQQSTTADSQCKQTIDSGCCQTAAHASSVTLQPAAAPSCPASATPRPQQLPPWHAPAARCGAGPSGPPPPAGWWPAPALNKSQSPNSCNSCSVSSCIVTTAAVLRVLPIQGGAQLVCRDAAVPSAAGVRSWRSGAAFRPLNYRSARLQQHQAAHSSAEPAAAAQQQHRTIQQPARQQQRAHLQESRCHRRACLGVCSRRTGSTAGRRSARQCKAVSDLPHSTTQRAGQNQQRSIHNGAIPPSSGGPSGRSVPSSRGLV